MIIKFVDTKEFRKDFAVKALPVKDMDKRKWCRVQGKQLKLALLNPKRAEWYHDTSWYYFVNDEDVTEWVEV